MFSMVPCNVSHDIVQGIQALNDKRCDSPHCKHRMLMLLSRRFLQTLSCVESEERFKFRVSGGLKKAKKHLPFIARRLSMILRMQGHVKLMVSSIIRVAGISKTPVLSNIFVC